jgi:hypothetical protein
MVVECLEIFVSRMGDALREVVLFPPSLLWNLSSTMIGCSEGYHGLLLVFQLYRWLCLSFQLQPPKPVVLTSGRFDAFFAFLDFDHVSCRLEGSGLIPQSRPPAFHCARMIARGQDEQKHIQRWLGRRVCRDDVCRTVIRVRLPAG